MCKDYLAESSNFESLTAGFANASPFLFDLQFITIKKITAVATIPPTVPPTIPPTN
jgi:hypothetical protein